MTDDFRAKIISILEEHWKRADGVSLLAIGDDDNLFELGIDSMTMVQVVTSIEEWIGSTIDFLDVDPEQFFTVRGMLEYVSKESVV
jgi:acyl carrier protein